MNVFVKVVAALLGMLIAGVLIGPSFIDWNQYKTEITKPIEELTGRKLTITGDVSFTILPAPAFAANGLYFANAKTGRAAHLASVETLNVRVAFFPLLSGRIQVESIVLYNPVISLEMDAEGRNNWDFRSSDQISPVSGEPEDDATFEVRFEQVVIENGTITYDDEANGISQRLSEITATVSATSLVGPYAAKGSLTLRQLPVLFEVLIGNLNSGRAVPLSFALALEDGAATMGFAGWASEPSLDARFNGRATIEGSDLSGTIDQVQAALEGRDYGRTGIPGALQTAFSAEAQVVVSSTEGRLRNLSVQLGDDAASGGFHITLNDSPVFDGNLEISSIDLDRWMTPVADTEEDTATFETPSAQLADKKPFSFALPANVSGTFKLSVGAVNYNDEIVRQIGLSLRMGDGRIGLESGTALLPGGSSLDAIGVLTAEAGQPRFAGRLNLESDNLRRLLSWLDVNIDQVPIDRLTRLSFASSIDVTPAVVQVFGIDATVDNTRVTGGVSLAVSERFAFGLDLDIDALDLDQYLGGVDVVVGSLDNPEPRRSNGGSVIGKIKKKLSLIDDFDANLRLRFDRFSWGGREVKDLALDGVLLDGEISINALKFGEYFGAGGTLTGNARDLSRKPIVDVRLEFTLSEDEALQRIFGDNVPDLIARLGAGVGTLSFSGNEGRVAVNLDADFRGTHITGRIGIVAPTAAPVIDAKVVIGNNSFAKMVSQFDLPLERPRGKDDSPVSLLLSAWGKPDNIEIHSTFNVGEGNVTVEGKVAQPATNPDYDLSVDLKAKDLKKWVRSFGFDFEPSAQNLGGLDASFSVSGSHLQATFDAFKGTVGPVAFKGKAKLSLTGDRPYLTGDLETSELVVDLFLSSPDAQGSARKAPSKAAQKWSREPFDFAFLQKYDGDIHLSTPGIVVGDFDFRDVKIGIALKDGVLKFRPLKARLFDGEADMSVELDTRGVPNLDVQLSLTNADIAAALNAAAGLEAIAGRAGFSGEFRTQGRSQFEMIAALSGSARIAAREGLIHGMDLRRLSDRMHNLDEIKDVLDVVSGSFDDGATGYRSVEGSIQVEKGVVRTIDVRTDVDAVETTITSEMDLVNWTMNTEVEFRLLDHPEAPSVGINLRGPIDSPRRNLKTRSLESYLIKRLAAVALNNLAEKNPTATDNADLRDGPDSRDGPDTTVGRVLEDLGVGPEREAEEVLRDLLKTLP